jgi:hypothetical protein
LRTRIVLSVCLLIIIELSSLQGTVVSTESTLVAQSAIATSGYIIQPDGPSVNGYVYTQNGIFYRNGSQITFFGVNYAPILSPFVYDVRESEFDFQKMKEYNFNFIRLPISWKLLQPKENSYSTDYLRRIDQTLDWAQKYAIYVMLSLIEVCPYTRPDWMTNRSELWSNTTLQNLYKTWGFLANRYKNRTIIIGYEVPYAEPEWPNDGSADNYYLTDWNNWLQSSYGSIQALNAAWNANTGSSLAPSENQFGNIQFNKPQGYGYNNNENARLHDFHQWYSQLYSKITANCANAIKTQDKMHLIIQAYECTRFPDDRVFLTGSFTTTPETISAKSQEFYAANMVYWTTTGDYTNQSIKEGGCYDLLQRKYSEQKLPTILSEVGSKANEEPSEHWTKHALENALNSDVQAIAVWCWLPTNSGPRDYIITDANRNLRSGFEFLPNMAKSFTEQKQTSTTPIVAIVAASRGGTARNTPVLVIADTLRQLGINFQILSDDFIIRNKATLNQYSVFFVIPEFMDSSAINTLKDLMTAEKKWSFWYGGITANAFLKKVGLGWAAAEIGMKNDPNRGSGNDLVYNSDQALTCVSTNGWGDLSQSEQIFYHTGAYQQLAITDSDIAGTEAVVRLRINQNSQIALWTVGKAAYFYDCYQKFDENIIATGGVLQITQAFLSWTGLLT